MEFMILDHYLSAADLRPPASPPPGSGNKGMSMINVYDFMVCEILQCKT